MRQDNGAFSTMGPYVMTPDPRDNDPLLLEIRRHGRRAHARGVHCLDTPMIAALAEGSATDSQRFDAAAHLPACALCRAELADAMRLLNDEALRAELPQDWKGRAFARRRTYTWAGAGAAFAAAATIAFVVAQTDVFHRESSGTAFRDETITVTPAPRNLAPLGVAPPELVFRWSRVPRADLYRVTVFDGEGVVIWNAESKDTAVTPPLQNPLRRGVKYLWKVDARTDFDRWVGSELTEFRCGSCAEHRP